MSKFSWVQKASLPFFAASLILTSCGRNNSGVARPASDPLEMQNDGDGVYRAHLQSLNESVAGITTGTVTVRLHGDEIIVEAAIAGAAPGIKHYQHIAQGAACPTLLDDSNGDGVVDAVEGSNRFGKFLIPLDSNINSQVDGSDFGPIANPAGAIVYRRSGSVAKLMSDLLSLDPTSSDDLIKLSPGERMILSGKKVVIQGVSADLPASALGSGERSAAETLPIACGELTRVTAMEEPTGLD